MGEEADPSTMGRAGVTLRPPMVVLRSIGGGIDMVGGWRCEKIGLNAV